MKKIFSKTGFSLIELIVALTLLSVIVLGIFSINSVLTNNNQDYGQKYLVKSETQSTLNHILKNASYAVGNATTDPYNALPELGILIGTSAATGIGNGDPVNNPNTFCIHQDIPIGAAIDSIATNDPPSSPPAFANSRWLCYTWYSSANVTYPDQIVYCAVAYTGTLAYHGATSCSGAVTEGPVYLGTAYSISNLNGAASPPTFNNDTFSITIQNCLNDALGTCSATGTSTDPANNPEVQISGNISASQESM